MKKFFVTVLFLAATGAAFAATNVVNPNQVNTENVMNDVDDMIASYDKYVDKYIATMKKVKAGDANAMSEYAKLLKQAQDLQKKLEKCKGNMTDAQVAKFQKVVAKLNKAVSEGL